jgi:hypothetical protein
MAEFAADGAYTCEGALAKIQAFKDKLSLDYVNDHTTDELIDELKVIINRTSGLVDESDTNSIYILWTGNVSSHI